MKTIAALGSFLLLATASAACSDSSNASSGAVSGNGSDGGSTSGSGSGSGSDSGTSSGFNTERIHAMFGGDASVDNGVLTLELPRTDLGQVQTADGMILTPHFGLQAVLFFQQVENGQVLVNGEMPLREQEVQPFVDALVAQKLIVQAYHQHDASNPQIWWVHFRGVCDGDAIASSVRTAMQTTQMQLPVAVSPGPKTTPLDAQRLGQILGGKAEVHDEGVVEVSIPRLSVVVDGMRVKAEAGIKHEIEFRPMSSGMGQGSGSDQGSGSGATQAMQVEVDSDIVAFGIEVNPILKVLRANDWNFSALHNHETDESPQVFFMHMGKIGDAYQLAQELRAGLDLAKGSSNGQNNCDNGNGSGSGSGSGSGGGSGWH